MSLEMGRPIERKVAGGNRTEYRPRLILAVRENLDRNDPDTKDGMPESLGFGLRDSKGHQRLNLALSDEDGSPSLTMYDPHEKTRAMMACDKEGVCGLAFMDRLSTEKARISVSKEGKVQTLDI